jgi:hypothetical protein
MNLQYRSAVTCKYCGFEMRLKDSVANKKSNTPFHVPFQQHRKSKWKVFAVLGIIVFALVWKASGSELYAQWGSALSHWLSTKTQEEADGLFGNESNPPHDNNSDTPTPEEKPQEIHGTPAPEPSESSDSTEEKLYSQLSSMVSRATKGESMKNTLPSTIEFRARILDKAVHMKTEEGEGVVYLPARISRNKNSFFLNFTSIPGKHPKPGDVVSVSGKLANTGVSWIEKNELRHALLIHVEGVEVVEPKVETQKVSKIELTKPGTQGMLEFKGAHLTRDSFRQAIVVYFNFTSTAKGTQYVNWMHKADISLDDNSNYYLDYSRTGLKVIDSQALSTRQAIKEGQTIYYYVAFSVWTRKHNFHGSNDANVKTLYLDKTYDDNFNISAMTLDVASSLAEMKKAEMKKAQREE